jgi:hypothetical protein
MSLKRIAIEVGKGVFAGAVTGAGLAVGRDVYVFVKEKFLGKKEQPTLVRIAEPDVVATATGQRCNQQ